MHCSIESATYVEKRSGNDMICRLLNPRIIQHQRKVLPSQFQQHRLERICSLRSNDATDLRRPREVAFAHLGVVDGSFVQGGSILRSVQDKVQNAGRETGIAEEGGEEIV